MTKNDQKYFASLKQKKYREKYGKFLIEGKKLIAEAMKSNWPIEQLFYSHEFGMQNSEFIDLTARNKIKSERIKISELEKLSHNISFPGVIAVLQKRSVASKRKSGIIAALNNINDPGNLGTIIRNCDWFGVDEIIVGNNSADIYNSKVIRAAMGSFFHIPVNVEADLINILKNMKRRGFSIYCADLDGESLYKTNFSSNGVFIFSSESHGPGEDILSIADKIIMIPSFGNAESLNVANSSAVILSEIKRRSIT